MATSIDSSCFCNYILSIEHDHLAWNGTRHLHKRPNPPLTLVNLDQSLVLIFSSIPQACKLCTSITPVNGFFANLLKAPLFDTTCISEKHIDDGNHSCRFLRNSTKMVLTRNYLDLLSVCVCLYGLFLDFYQNVIIDIVQKWSNKCMMLMKKDRLNEKGHVLKIQISENVKFLTWENGIREKIRWSIIWILIYESEFYKSMPCKLFRRTLFSIHERCKIVMWRNVSLPFSSKCNSTLKMSYILKFLDPSGKTVSTGYFQELQVHVSISLLTS